MSDFENEKAGRAWPSRASYDPRGEAAASQPQTTPVSAGRPTTLKILRQAIELLQGYAEHHEANAETLADRGDIHGAGDSGVKAVRNRNMAAALSGVLASLEPGDDTSWTPGPGHYRLTVTDDGSFNVEELTPAPRPQAVAHAIMALRDYVNRYDNDTATHVRTLIAAMGGADLMHDVEPETTVDDEPEVMPMGHRFYREPERPGEVLAFCEAQMKEHTARMVRDGQGTGLGFGFVWTAIERLATSIDGLKLLAHPPMMTLHVPAPDLPEIPRDAGQITATGRPGIFMEFQQPEWGPQDQQPKGLFDMVNAALDRIKGMGTAAGPITREAGSVIEMLAGQLMRVNRELATERLALKDQMAFQRTYSVEERDQAMSTIAALYGDMGPNEARSIVDRVAAGLGLKKGWE